MKKLSLIISFVFLFLFSFSQSIDSTFESSVNDFQDLPQYFIQNDDTVGILLSVSQLQKLDNNTELLELFKVMDLQCDSINSYYVGIIDDLENKIHIQEVKISNLLQQIDEQNSMIENLKQQVLNKSIQIDISNQQSNNKDKIIDGLKEDLRKANTKKVIGWTSTGVTAAVVIALSIFIGTR